MELPFFQVDAFTVPGRALSGNPAAVMPLDDWLDDAVLQAIAAENNLSETAFTVALPAGSKADFALRWFTPEVEVDLCGHATLAAGSVLIGARDALRFTTRSGVLGVARDGDRFALDLPAARLGPAREDAALAAALGLDGAVTAIAVTGANDPLLAILPDAATVRALAPDIAALGRFAPLVIVTAPAEAGAPVDLVSRVFAPGCGIAEDPVTGSAHCALVPYWAARLGRDAFVCAQASARGGELHARLDGMRVRLAGRAERRIEGRFFL